MNCLSLEIAVTKPDVSIEDAVRSAIASTCQLDLEAVGTEQIIDDLGLDSMRILAVIGLLEAAYERDFGPDQIISLLQAATVGELAVALGKIVLPKALSHLPTE
jgi:acyl carrier protein